MDYSTLGLELVKVIPEIKSDYEKEVELWDGEQPGPHIIFGDILNPFLIDLLHFDNVNQDLLVRIFDFLEELAKCEDVLVQEVLACTVLERLGDEITVLKKAKPFMGELTRKLSCEIEKGLGRRS